MIAVVLAAGFAERLRPLTDGLAKPLLPIAGRPLLDWICDAIEKAAEFDEIAVVTNALYARDFERWAAGRRGLPIRILDDGSRSNDERRGAIGALQFAVDALGTNDDLLVVAGDNLSDIRFRSLIDYARARRGASCVAVHTLEADEDASPYGVVEIDSSGRIVAFVEKPSTTRSRLIATAIYVLEREHVRAIRVYLGEGGSADHLGSFVGWLSRRAPVVGFRWNGEWRDIGDSGCLLEADNAMRERLGMPVRAAYALDSA